MEYLNADAHSAGSRKGGNACELGERFVLMYGKMKREFYRNMRLSGTGVIERTKTLVPTSFVAKYPMTALQVWLLRAKSAGERKL